MDTSDQMENSLVPRHKLQSIACAATFAITAAFVGHELGHVVGGWLVGGLPRTLTTTEIRGDFHDLTPFGFVILGASGSVANLLFCAFGWLGMRHRSECSEVQLTAWLFFGVNGTLVATKMIAEPIAGFGDWITVLNHLPAKQILSYAVVVGGIAGVWWSWFAFPVQN